MFKLCRLPRLVISFNTGFKIEFFEPLIIRLKEATVANKIVRFNLPFTWLELLRFMGRKRRRV